jgi:hypothetical protein
MNSLNCLPLQKAMMPHYENLAEPSTAFPPQAQAGQQQRVGACSSHSNLAIREEPLGERAAQQQQQKLLGHSSTALATGNSKKRIDEKQHRRTASDRSPAKVERMALFTVKSFPFLRRSHPKRLHTARKS